LKTVFKKLLVLVLVVSLASFAAVNLIARNHVRAMMVFVDGGVRTERPEALIIWEKLTTIVTGVTVPRPVIHQTPSEIGLDVRPITIENRIGQKSRELILLYQAS
jgi:hypothetical protein